MFTVRKEFGVHVARVLMLVFRNTAATQDGDKITFLTNADEKTVRRICERAYCDMLAREEKRKTGSRMLPVLVSESEVADEEYLRSFTAGTRFVVYAYPEYQYTASETAPETHSYMVREDLVPFVKRVLVRSFFICDVTGRVIHTNAENFKAIVGRAYCEMCSEDSPLFLVSKEEEQVPQYLGTLTWRFQSHGYAPVSVDTEELFSKIC